MQDLGRDVRAVPILGREQFPEDEFLEELCQCDGLFLASVALCVHSMGTSKSLLLNAQHLVKP